MYAVSKIPRFFIFLLFALETEQADVYIVNATK